MIVYVYKWEVIVNVRTTGNHKAIGRSQESL